MKKLFLSLFAVIGSFAAFGQDNAYVNFDPVSGSELTTLNTNIKVTLNTDSSATTAVVQTIGGYGSIQYAPDPEIAIIEEVDGEKVINISLTSDLWGTPYFEMYYLQVMVVPMTDDMTPIETEDGDYVMGIASYTCADSGEARLELTFPNQQNIDNEMYSIAQAYEMGTCSAFFSKKVVASASGGTISIYDFDGEELASSELIFNDEEWSDMDGLYQVNYAYDSEEGISAEDIARMEIQLEGVKYDDNTEMNISTITLFPKQVAKSAPRKINKTSLSENLISSDAFKIFNIQGVLINGNATKADVDSLPAGLYIVNGKKVLVK